MHTQTQPLDTSACVDTPIYTVPGVPWRRVQADKEPRSSKQELGWLWEEQAPPYPAGGRAGDQACQARGHAEDQACVPAVPGQRPCWGPGLHSCSAQPEAMLGTRPESICALLGSEQHSWVHSNEDPKAMFRNCGICPLFGSMYKALLGELLFGKHAKWPQQDVGYIFLCLWPRRQNCCCHITM